MFNENGIYEQGAIISKKDFEPLKTIEYFCSKYDVKLNKKIKDGLKEGSILDDTLIDLCNEFDIAPSEYTLEAISDKLWNEHELTELVLNGEKVKFGNEIVEAIYYPNLFGNFSFYDETLGQKSISGGCLMLRFNLPFIWDLKSKEIPKSTVDAVTQLQKSTKSLLKKDIDWKQRLGCLMGTGVCI